MMTAPITKRITFHCYDFKGFIDVDATDTLKDVRRLILNEFGDSVLPRHEWSFRIDGITISSKQEQKNNVWQKVLGLGNWDGKGRCLEISTKPQKLKFSSFGYEKCILVKETDSLKDVRMKIDGGFCDPSAIPKGEWIFSLDHTPLAEEQEEDKLAMEDVLDKNVELELYPLVCENPF